MPLVVIIDQGINHDADVFVADAPVVLERAAFAVKSEAFDKSRRGRVVRLDQCLDPMDMEFVSTVVEHSSDGLCPQTAPLVLGPNDVTQFEAAVPRVTVVIPPPTLAFLVRSCTAQSEGRTGRPVPRKHASSHG